MFVKKGFILAMFFGVVSTATGAAHAWTIAPIARTPWIGDVSQTTATIRWETTGTATTVVKFTDPDGTITYGYGTSEAISGGRWRHTVHAGSGLAAGKVYYFSTPATAPIKNGKFRTSPSSSIYPFNFVAVGDYQGIDYHVLYNMYSKNSSLGYGIASLYVDTGDMATSESGWDLFFGNSTFLPQGAFYSVRGNNDPEDWGDDASWSSIFYMPQVEENKYYYAIDFYNTRFLFLYSGINDSSAEFDSLPGLFSCLAPADQTEWVYCQLSDAEDDTSIDNVIVVLHQPPITYPPALGSHHHQNAAEHTYLMPLLEDCSKTRLVLSGHNHFYQRMIEGGIDYFVIGGGGADLYNVPSPKPSEMTDQQSMYHFLSVKVDQETISIRVIEWDGSVFSLYDEFTL